LAYVKSPEAVEKRILIAVDDTQKSYTGTSETAVKTFRFPVTIFNRKNFWHIAVSLWVSAGTGYIKFYFDSEGTARLTLSTTSSTETVLEGDINFNNSPLSIGLHTCTVKIYNSGSSTTYTKWFGVWEYGI
jgi:hypothetical protein